MKRSPTIKDIARQAKVSATAVSMALNDRPGVSTKTRKRILRLAKELDYQPNFIAKSLISNRSYTIGLIVNNIADPFYPEIAQGIEEKANARGYSLLLCNTSRSLTGEKRCIDTLRAKGVDGLIITTATVDDPHVAALVEARFPFVLINRHSTDPSLANKISYVVLDNHACGFCGVTHLFRLGHDRIALIGGDMHTSTAALRYEGAIQALRTLGVKPDGDLFVACDYIREKAHAAALRLLDLPRPPTAFFAWDDHMALGVREAVLGRGLRIPEDIALVGVDDTEMAALTGVDLTSVSQKQYEMGAMGVGILINSIEEATPQMANTIVLEAKLVKRKSCGYHLGGYVR